MAVMLAVEPERGEPTVSRLARLRAPLQDASLERTESVQTRACSHLRASKDGARQPAKTTLFAGGNGADVRKSAVGDFCQLTSPAAPPSGAGLPASASRSPQ